MSKRTSKRRTSRRPARVSRNSVTAASAWSDTEEDFRRRSVEAQKILLAQHDPMTLLDAAEELIESVRDKLADPTFPQLDYYDSRNAARDLLKATMLAEQAYARNCESSRYYSEGDGECWRSGELIHLAENIMDRLVDRIGRGPTRETDRVSEPPKAQPWYKRFVR